MYKKELQFLLDVLIPVLFTPEFDRDLESMGLEPIHPEEKGGRSNVIPFPANRLPQTRKKTRSTKKGLS